MAHYHLIITPTIVNMKSFHWTGGPINLSFWHSRYIFINQGWINFVVSLNIFRVFKVDLYFPFAIAMLCVKYFDDWFCCNNQDCCRCAEKRVIYIAYKVWHHYNPIKYNTILHVTIQYLRQNIDKNCPRCFKVLCMCLSDGDPDVCWRGQCVSPRKAGGGRYCQQLWLSYGGSKACVW